MSTEQPKTENQKSSKKGSLALFIILFIASLALSAFLFFKYAKNADSQAQSLKNSKY